MTVSISARRAIMASAVSRPGFRDLLRRDPRAGFEQATGEAAPQDARFRLIEEGADAWAFVVPANDIDPELPEAFDARGAIENQVYRLLRDEPGVRETALRDPRAFVFERLNLDLGATGIDVHEEQPGEIVLVLPDADSREELNDAALDLVAGGGNNTTASKGEDMDGPRDP